MLNIKCIEKKYKVGKVIGRGTFGTVRACRLRARPGIVVAVKRLRSTPTNPMHLREVLFFHTVPAHAHILDLYDMFVDSKTGSVVFELERMEGTLLKFVDFMRKTEADFNGLDPWVVSSIIGDILHGVEHIHRHGFVHRDLKPENILFTRRGDAFVFKIADFGLSRRIELRPGLSQYNWTTYVATRWYRAPEQILGLPFHTPALDVWAVTTIMIELSNGVALFPGKDTTEMVTRHLSVLGTPSQRAPGGPSVDVSRALEKSGVMPYMGVLTPSQLIRRQDSWPFYDLAISGLQWDMGRRPSASEMRSMLKGVQEYLTPHSA